MLVKGATGYNVTNVVLTHSSQDKTTIILQMKFSNSFLLVKIVEFWLAFYKQLFQLDQITIRVFLPVKVWHRRGLLTHKCTSQLRCKRFETIFSSFENQYGGTIVPTNCLSIYNSHISSLILISYVKIPVAFAVLQSLVVIVNCESRKVLLSVRVW